MAMLPEEKTAYSKESESIKVTRVVSEEEFSVWADICNAILHNNYPIIHRINHYEICRKNIMKCYLAYYRGEAAGISAILDNDGIVSLEFVATLSKYRRLGIAKMACQSAVDEAFSASAKVITTRAFQAAKNIYKALGFKVYY
jgi:ribosomal protein S18 acetylase RimI-like enzyme